MSKSPPSLPIEYEIKVKGHLGQRLARHFEGLELKTGFHDGGTAVSILSGRIRDQAALHGVLERARDLGMEIVSVNQIRRESQRRREPRKSTESKMSDQMEGK